jgi:hypothetical protein
LYRNFWHLYCLICHVCLYVCIFVNLFLYWQFPYRMGHNPYGSNGCKVNWNWKLMSSQAHFESDKQVIIWRYKVRIVGGMWQHCPSKTSDGLSGAHLCEALHYHRGVTQQTFCQMNSTNTSLQTTLYFNTAVGVHCCSHTQIVQNNNIFLIPYETPSKILEGHYVASTL